MTELSASVCDARAEAARQWALAQLRLEQAEFAPASTDASFRRYFRLGVAGRSWIVMDAPPEQEDCQPFLQVGALLREAGVHVPEVLARDLDRGYLLLSDLGKQTYLHGINAENADALFSDAIDALIAWQRASRPDVLPEYDDALLRRELALFPEWYLQQHLGVTLDGAEAATLQLSFDLLITAALAQPRVFVHRDYMPRNLMLSQPNPGVLDYQDAVYGPLAYDPICLFKDAFVSWPAERVDGWLRQYHAAAGRAGLPIPVWDRFRRDCDWIGLQRHLKVLGIFARINYRDGKPDYVADTPRFVRYVMEVLPRYEALSPLRDLFERRVLPKVGLK